MSGPTTRGVERHRSPHAVRVGVRRGLTEFGISLRNPEDQTFYLFWAAGVLAVLWFNRDATVPGVSLSFPVLALPGLLAALVVFGAVVGSAFALVTEKEDGTLLRAKAAPHGITGYVVGQVVLQALGVLPMTILVLVPSALLFDGVNFRGAAGWLAAAGFLVLGLLVTLPLGMVIGALARRPSHVTTWGLLPVLALGGISGILVPLQALWGWVQVVAQLFPMYWLGAGLRWALLPEEAAAFELGGAFRPGEAVGVLGLWAVVGLLVAPVVLQRMARRESGSAVRERMEERMKRVA
jgi:ABC-2 type transport system permease protein